MTDPYEILELKPGCSEAEIRRRYLELVRRHPPDRDPRRFAEIRDAYDRIRDPVVRLESELFSLKTSESLDTMMTEVRQRLRSTRIPLDTLLSLAE